MDILKRLDDPATCRCDRCKLSLAHGLWIISLRVSEPKPDDDVLREYWIRVPKSRKVTMSRDGVATVNDEYARLHMFDVERVMLLCARCGFSTGPKGKLVKSLSRPGPADKDPTEGMHEQSERLTERRRKKQKNYRSSVAPGAREAKMTWRDTIDRRDYR